MPRKVNKLNKARSNSRMGGAFSYVGIPADADERMPVVTVTGKRYVRIEHHRGILLFTDRCVKLFSAQGLICISGRELASASMDGDQVLLEGEIGSVSFE